MDRSFLHTQYPLLVRAYCWLGKCNGTFFVWRWNNWKSIEYIPGGVLEIHDYFYLQPPLINANNSRKECGKEEEGSQQCHSGGLCFSSSATYQQCDTEQVTFHSWLLHSKQSEWNGHSFPLFDDPEWWKAGNTLECYTVHAAVTKKLSLCSLLYQIRLRFSFFPWILLYW